MDSYIILTLCQAVPHAIFEELPGGVARRYFPSQALSRQLSPRALRGGEPRTACILSSLLHSLIYFLANSVKFLVYFPIAETQHF